MPTPNATRFQPARRPGKMRPLSALALVASLLAGGCQIPPDVLRMPAYVYESLTNPNFVVNAPVLHDLFGISRGLASESTQQSRFRLPPGFIMNVYADGITLARFMRTTPTGDLIVTQPRKRRVILLARDDDEDGRADGQRVLLDGLHLPHGVELVGDMLYVAGPAYILRVGFDIEAGRTVGEPEIFAHLPDTAGHNSRPLRLGPDGWLYTAIGADCNVCEPTTDRDQAILRFDPSTGREEIVASGFRNPAQLAWQPASEALFVTEVGVDYQGDDNPLEELNQIVPGGFYGFPYLHGPDYRDPEFAHGHEDRITDSIPPVHTFTAHSTPLGLRFLENDRLPDAYRGAALVVLKGSWNRTRKSGYKVVSLHWTKGESGSRIEQRDFLTGFERDEDVIGRPVDLVEHSDGTLFLSDDTAGAIYRIRYAPDEVARPDLGTMNAIEAQMRQTTTENLARLGPDHLDEVERAALHKEGQRLFARHGCATCHAGTQTRAAPVSLTGIASRRTIDDVLGALREPPASMPRFLLTEDERQALAVYVLGRDWEH